MLAWGVVFLVAIARITVSADPELFTFPEIARGNAGSRIVSGWEAEEGQIPFQLSMRMVNPIGTVNACGGSIIHKDWGMTAAHCTAMRVTMVLRAGAVNLTRPEILFETTEYYNHPDYIDALQAVQAHDIALLKFPYSLTFSHRVQPVRLQRRGDMNRSYSGVRLVASGWGLTWTQGTSPENMNWVFLSGVSNQACYLAYGGSSIIVDSTICTVGYNVSSQSTCQGDSGGPLTVVDDDGQLSEIGVASFVSATGCHTDLPAGFIRPGHYHDWYYDVTGINFDWDPEASTTAEPEPTTVPTTPESDESEEVVYTTTAAPESSESDESEEVVYTTTAAPESSESDESEEVVYTTTAAPESSESDESEEVVYTTTAAPESSESDESEEVVYTTTAAPESSESDESEEVVFTTTAAPESSESDESEEVVYTTTAAPELSESDESEEVVYTTTAAPESSESEEIEVVYPTTAAPPESSESEEIEVVYPTTADPPESSESEEVDVVYPTTAPPESSESDESEEEVVHPTTDAPESSESDESEEVEVVLPTTAAPPESSESEEIDVVYPTTAEPESSEEEEEPATTAAPEENSPESFEVDPDIESYFNRFIHSFWRSA